RAGMLSATSRTFPDALKRRSGMKVLGRTSEALGARWDEIDLSASTRTIPAGRMKGNVAHRVPLSKAAVRLLERVPKATYVSDLQTDSFVFLGRNRSRPAETALYKCTRSLGCQYTGDPNPRISFVQNSGPQAVC